MAPPGTRVANARGGSTPTPLHACLSPCTRRSRAEQQEGAASRCQTTVVSPPHSYAGSLSSKTVRPSLEETVASPPCARMIERVIANPSPAPSEFLCRDGSAR